MNKKILLLTKNFPPQIWGIEKYAFDLYNHLIQDWNEVKLITTWTRNEWLQTRSGSIMHTSVCAKYQDIMKIRKIFWKICYFTSEFSRFFCFAFRVIINWSIWLMVQGLKIKKQKKILKHEILIWCMDGSIVGLGVFLGKIFRVTTRVTIHGTEIVWGKKLYQHIIPRIIAQIDEIYVISKNTRQECVRRGIPEKKMILVPHTINSISFINTGIFDKFEFLQNLWVVDSKNKIILFSIGRWIERKGFHWFLENVLCHLDSQRFHYILAGFGPYEKLYKDIVYEKSIKHISIVWKIDDPMQKAKIYTSSDVFIMPNIPVFDNIEWYPLVLMEAKYYWLERFVGHVQGIEDELGIIKCFNDKNLWIKNLNAY